MADVVERLAHARTTASNDDLSKPGTSERERHCERLAAMQDATVEIETLRARLSQAGHAGGGVVVRPLEWVDRVGSCGSFRYTIAPPSMTPGWRVWGCIADVMASVGGILVTARAADEEAAKAAAQADYEARILAAAGPVVPTPQASVEAVAAIIAKWVDEERFADAPAFRMAAREIIASLTPAPTQGDGHGLHDALVAHSESETASEALLASELHHEPHCALWSDEPGDCDCQPTPSPSPMSAPSPAGGVREAIEFALKWDQNRDFIMPYRVRDKLRAALSSPATPEPGME